MNKVKWKNVIIALVIISIIGTLALGTVSSALKKKEKKPNIIIEKSEAPSDLYESLNLTIENKESETFTSSIMVPLTQIDSVDELIEDWVEDLEDDFYKEVKKENKNLNENFRAHLNIQTDVIELSENIVTLVLNSYMFTGKSEGLNEIKPFTIDLKKKEQKNLSDVLNLDTKDHDKFIGLVEAEVKKNKELKDSIDFKVLNKNISKDNDFSWLLNKDGIKLIFDENTVIPASSELVEVNVPITKLNPILDKQISLDLNVQEKIDEEIKKEEEKQRKLAEEKRIKERKESLKNLDQDKKYVAITFDDGPSTDVTPKVLDHLDKYDAVATFYMLGNQAKANAKIAKQVADKGHEIANHSVTHADLSSVSRQRVHDEIFNATSSIEKATGIRPTSFRPPYGAINQNVLDKAKEINQPIILWSVDSLDWKSRNKDAIYSKVMNQMHSGAIVLLHDIHPETADALPSILSALTKQGYEFVTVTDLLQLTGEEKIGPYHSQKK